MFIAKISDGRTCLYQWDTGVKIELRANDTVTEMHFVTPTGTIKRDVENNVVSVPDVALQTAGTLMMYAFVRNDVYGITRHEVSLGVIARPKPADYIDPPDESAFIDQVCDRLKVLPECKGEKGEQGDTGPAGPQGEPGQDAPQDVVRYAAQSLDTDQQMQARENIGAADAVTVNGLKDEKADKKDIPEPYTLPIASVDTLGGVKVGNGLQMDGDVLGVKPEGEYELIETITLDEDMTAVERTTHPDGTTYNLAAVKVIGKFYYPIAASIGTRVDFLENGKKLGTLVVSVMPNNTETTYFHSTVLYQVKPVAGTYEFLTALGSQGGAMNVMYPPNGAYQSIATVNKVTQINIVAWQNTFPAGTAFEIWGVRADA